MFIQIKLAKKLHLLEIKYNFLYRHKKSVKSDSEENDKDKKSRGKKKTHTFPSRKMSK